MHPFCKTIKGQKTLLFIDPSLWNNLPEPIKKANNLNTQTESEKTLYK